MAESYHKERDKKNVLKLRELCKEMPSFVTQFFIGIEMRTSPLTRLNYGYDLRIFLDYLSKMYDKPIMKITIQDLENVTSFDLETYISQLSAYTFNGKEYSCGEQAKQRKLAVLRTFFGYFFKKNMLTSNVADKVDMPKLHSKPIIRLEVDEVARLLDETESGAALSKHQGVFHEKTVKRDLAILTLFLGTGIRISELIGLNMNDIDFSINSFKVTRKGGGTALLYFSDEVADALKDYFTWLDFEEAEQTPFFQKLHNNGFRVEKDVSKNTDPLFFSLQGKRISVRAVEDLVKKYSRIVSPLKNISPHKLRSTYGTALYRETQDIYVVAEVLGHKDINTTRKHYAEMSDDIRRSAAKAVKLKSDTDD